MICPEVIFLAVLLIVDALAIGYSTYSIYGTKDEGDERLDREELDL